MEVGCVMSKEEKKKEPEEEPEEKVEEKKIFGIAESQLVASGIRIGTTIATKHMKPFISRTREDGLNIMDMNKILSRIELAGKFLARFDPKKVLIHTTREAAYTPVQKFCELTGTSYILGRIIPGTLTNPSLPFHKDVDVVLVVDPQIDVQAVEEAKRINVPIVAICDTNNVCSYVDLIIPGNNRGRKSLAMIFWLLARSYLINAGLLAPGEQLKYTPEDFETKLEKGQEIEG